MNDWAFLASLHKPQLNVELHCLLLPATFPKFTQILHHSVLLIVQTGEEAQGSGKIHLCGHPGPKVKQEEPQHSQSQRRALPTSLPISRSNFYKICPFVTFTRRSLSLGMNVMCMVQELHRNAFEVIVSKLYLLYFCCISTCAILVE